MNYPSEDNPVCINCGLFQGCRSPFMRADGASEPLVLVVGESPGENEDLDGVPFVGQSGQLLRNVLKEVGYEPEDLKFTNTVRCRPPNNKITKKAIEHCKQFMLQDIIQAQPKVVFLMGNTPLQAVLGQTGITQWNGVVINKKLEGMAEEVKFVPLYHPAYILRDYTHFDVWVEAMLAVSESNDNPYNEDSYEYIYPHSVDEVVEMYEYLAGYKWISYDTEVSVLDPFSDASLLLAVSFAAEGIAYSLPIDHPESWWTDVQSSKVCEIVIDVLTSHDGYLIGHNIKFDQLQTLGLLETEIKAGGDTMLVSHLLDSRQGIHGLKRLAGLHLGMYEYDSEIEAYKKEHREADYTKGGSMTNVPLEIMLPYSAKDAEATYKLHQKLYPELSDKQKVLYRQLIMPVSDALMEMQANGLAIDYHIANRYQILYSMEREKVYKQICKDPKVKKMLKFNETKTFNPNSSQQLGELLFEWYKLKPTAHTPKGTPSTSADALKMYVEKYPIVDHVHMYKLLTKMLSTYLEPCANGAWSSGDRRVRTNYNLHGTKTGRLSSSQPVNLQNIPTPEKEPGTILETLPVKNMFTHSWSYEKI